jgi:hypothetical protein
MPLCLALIHFPVINKHDRLVCSSITNFDIHDIARSCRTFGVDRYFVVTPSEPSQWLARRIIHHWQEGWGADYNPNRRDALDLIEVAGDLAEVVERCNTLWGKAPVLVGTSAKPRQRSLSVADLRVMLENPDEVVCLVFGTAWGLHHTLVSEMDFFLEPIRGLGDYCHLSVRAAVSIYLDRLRGRFAADAQWGR